VSIDDPPLATLAGLALRLTVGAGRIVTRAVLLAFPPAPVQVSVKSVVVVRAPVD
jgi:hypothetical protein